MNGQSTARMTACETQEALREHAAEQRAAVVAKRAARRETRHLIIFVSCCVMFAAGFIGGNVWIQHGNQMGEITLQDSGQGSFICIWGCDKTPDGWWNPRFSDDMDGARRYFSDRWTIGRHDYSTRDLMGRGI